MITRPKVRLYRIKTSKTFLYGTQIDKNTRIIIDVNNQLVKPKSTLKIFKSFDSSKHS